jgi:hypothetical protein
VRYDGFSPGQAATPLPNSEQEFERSVATEAEKKYNSRLPKHHFSD